MKEIQDVTGARSEISGVHLTAQENVDGRERQGEPGHGGLIYFLNHYVSLQKIDSRIDERQNRWNRGKERGLPLRLKSNQRGNREDCKKQGGECERQAELGPGIELRVPANVEQKSAGVAHHQQPPPRLERDQDKGRDIQNHEIRKESDFAILSGRKQKRSAETSREGEGGENLGVLCQRHGSSRGRHQKHHGKSDAAGNQAVALKRRPEREVKSADSNRLQRVGKRLVTLQAEAFAPQDDGDAGNQADGDAPGGADPIVIEGKLQEVGDPDQQSGDPYAIEPVGSDAGFEVN